MLVFDCLGPRVPRAWRVGVNPFYCFVEGEPPAPALPGGGPAPITAPVTPPTPPRAAGQSDSERVAQLEEINANLRVEAATRRVSERDARDRLAANDQEVARLRQDADARERTAREQGSATTGRIKQRTIDAELRAAATAAGLRDPDLLPLIDRSALTCDDDGNVAGVQEAITAFKTKKPEYFAVPNSGGGPAPRAGENINVRSGNPAPPPPGPGAQPNAAGPDVRTIPKGVEGRQQYKAALKTALSTLR